MTGNNTTERRWWGSALTLLAGFLLLAGCNKDDYQLAYSHSLHVKDNGMACKDCHGQATAGRFVLPGHKACTDCHSDWIETKTIGPKTCGVCHKVKDLQALAAVKPAAPVAAPARAFLHTAALSNRCNECHGLLMDAKLKNVPEMTRSAKITIRDRAHSWGMDCAACHEHMSPQMAPANHETNWIRKHGILGSQRDNVCGVCHRAQTCRECHQVMMPASHNNLWRLKTHGIRAAWDRARCMVCHQQDACIACHTSTKPQTHDALWRQNHCPACHVGSGAPGASVVNAKAVAAAWPAQITSAAKLGTGCALCHDTNIGSHPDPHPANWRNSHCTQCHLGSPDAAQCKTCHGADTVGVHPNPHGAGWQTQHCNSCHPGTAQTAQCQSCHGGSYISSHPDPHPGGWRSRHCFSCHAGGSAADDCGRCHQNGGNISLHQSFWPPMHNKFGPGADCSICHKP